MQAEVKPKFEFKWRQQLGLAECPYMERWVLGLFFFSIRVHHWFRSDDDKYFHDHPWWFWTFVVRGGYLDSTPTGDEMVKQGTFHFRPALHRHTVYIVPEIPTWTICLTGPEMRMWGFWIGEKFVKARRYFFKYGHHPCESGEMRQRTNDRKL